MSDKKDREINDLLKQLRDSMNDGKPSEDEKLAEDGFDQKLAALLEKHVGDGQYKDGGELLDDESEFSLEELQIMKDGAAILVEADDEESDLDEPEIDDKPEVEDEPIGEAEEEIPPLMREALEDAFSIDDLSEYPIDEDENVIEIKEDSEIETIVFPDGADDWLDADEDENFDEWSELDAVSDIDDIDSIEDLEALDELLDADEDELEVSENTVVIEELEETDELDEPDELDELDELDEIKEFTDNLDLREEENDSLDEELSDTLDTEENDTEDLFDTDEAELSSLDISDILSEEDSEENIENEFPAPDEDIFEDNEASEAIESVTEEAEEINEETKLALRLGFEENLEEQLGRDKVREIKEDILREENEVKPERPVDDYSDHSEDSKIKKNYRNRKILEVFKFSGTLIIAILIGIYENMKLLGLSLPGLPSEEEQTALYILIATLGFAAAAALSWRCLWRGFKSIFNLEPEAHSLTAAVTVLNIVHNIVAIIVCRGDVELFNFPTAICLTFTTVYELLCAVRESCTFDVISAVGERYMLEEDRGELPQKKRSNRAKTYSVRRGDFTDGYFKRTNAASRGIYLLNYMIVPLVATALVMAVITASLTASAVSALAAFLASLLICMPSAILVVLSLPGAIAAMRLAREGCAIIGEAGENEYARDKLVVFDDVTLFPSKNIKTNGIKLYEGFEIYDVLIKTAALFSAVGGPLSEIFDSDDIGSAISEKYHKEAEVKLIRCTRGGVEAWIDGDTNILAGTQDFLGQYGINLPSNSRDEQLKEAGEVTLVYIAIDRRAAARLYVDYRVDEKFEHELELLKETRTRLAIRTADPAICDELLEKKRRRGNAEIGIIRVEPRECEVAEYIDSGIVARGDARDILLPIAAASRLKKLRRRGLGVSFGVFLFNLIIALLLTVTGMIKYASSWSVTLYMIVLSLPTVLVSFGAMKIGKLPNKKKDK